MNVKFNQFPAELKTALLEQKMIVQDLLKSCFLPKDAWEGAKFEVDVVDASGSFYRVMMQKKTKYWVIVSQKKVQKLRLNPQLFLTRKQRKIAHSELAKKFLVERSEFWKAKQKEKRVRRNRDLSGRFCS